jgi:hypothetical protein
VRISPPPIDTLTPLIVERRTPASGFVEIARVDFAGEAVETTLVDPASSPATEYRYRVRWRFADTEFTSAEVAVTTPTAPLPPPGRQLKFAAAPNPAHNALHLAFDLPTADRATIEVFDLGGRRMRTLVVAQAGHHELDIGPVDLSSGVYLVRITHAGTIRTLRVALAR